MFLAFWALFVVRARRAGLTTREWLDRRNAAMAYTPGWWKPMAVILPVAIAAYVVVASVQHGFRWQYLLAFPLLGGFFAVSAAFLSWVSRRQVRRPD
jgi:hypothetical protein